MEYYPLKFTPIIKDKIWGGQRLKTLLHKDFGSLPNGGESWELSTVDGNVSIIANGELRGLPLTEAIALLRGELVGNSVYARFGTNFPLLIKFIDANDNLSVQVHPDDAMAAARHGCFGKTEMWYVVASKPGAQLISGFAKQITADDYKPLLDAGKFLETLAVHKVKHGDVFFMPAGRIHAIGRGVMVAEIQQTSDITYRVFDYNRRDAQGRERELHVDAARDAINFDDLDSGKKLYAMRHNKRVQVVDCQYFLTGIILVYGDSVRDYSVLDSCVILICVKGAVTVENEQLACGETMLVPAAMKHIVVHSDERSEILEVFIPQPA